MGDSSDFSRSGALSGGVAVAGNSLEISDQVRGRFPRPRMARAGRPGSAPRATGVVRGRERPEGRCPAWARTTVTVLSTDRPYSVPLGATQHRRTRRESEKNRGIASVWGALTELKILGSEGACGFNPRPRHNLVRNSERRSMSPRLPGPRQAATDPVLSLFVGDVGPASEPRIVL
jgi:hypothetical protein